MVLPCSGEDRLPAGLPLSILPDAPLKGLPVIQVKQEQKFTVCLDQFPDDFVAVVWVPAHHVKDFHENDAFKLYSGDRPYGIFVSKLGDNLKELNRVYDDIVSLFNASGIDGFEKLPTDTAVRAKFAKLFKELNTYLESAKIQGFSWNILEYKAELISGETEKIIVSLDENTYLTLAIRYKELFSHDPDGGSGEDIPYEIDSHLTEINTGTIDRNYMESHFRKYLKQLQDGVEYTAALKELYKSFAVLTQEQQKYAKIFLADVQQGDIVVAEDKTLMDYIIQYQTEAQDDRIHRFSVAIGIDEAMLRDFMKRDVTDGSINEFGLFDRLKATVDRVTAKAYFESVEGQPVPARLVSVKVDKILRLFILSGGADIL